MDLVQHIRDLVELNLWYCLNIKVQEQYIEALLRVLVIFQQYIVDSITNAINIKNGERSDREPVIIDNYPSVPSFHYGLCICNLILAYSSSQKRECRAWKNV